MGMKKLPPSKDRIAELEEKTQKMLDRLGPDQVKFEKTFSYLPLQLSLDVCMNIKNFHSG